MVWCSVEDENNDGMLECIGGTGSDIGDIRLQRDDCTLKLSVNVAPECKINGVSLHYSEEKYPVDENGFCTLDTRYFRENLSLPGVKEFKESFTSNADEIYVIVQVQVVCPFDREPFSLRTFW